MVERRVPKSQSSNSQLRHTHTHRITDTHIDAQWRADVRRGVGWSSVGRLVSVGECGVVGGVGVMCRVDVERVVTQYRNKSACVVNRTRVSQLSRRLSQSRDNWMCGMVRKLCGIVGVGWRCVGLGGDGVHWLMIDELVGAACPLYNCV